MPDCGLCHGPQTELPTLARLLPTSKIVLDVVLLAATDAAERDAWRDELVKRLAEEGVSVVRGGAPAASVVTITLTRDAGGGRTDGGAVFHAVSYAATVRILRTETRVRGAPRVSPDAPTARQAAREDLIDRLVITLTL